MSTNDRGDKGPIDDKKRRTGLLYLLIMAALAAYLVFNAQGLAGFGGKTVTLSTSEFVTAVKAGRVKEATYKAADGTLTGSYWASAKKRDSGADPTKFKSTYVGDDTLSELMADNPKVKYTVDTSQPGMWTDLLITLVPTLMVVGVMLYFLNQMQGQNGKAMGFGKTKAKTSEQTRPKVKFSDVAGIDEAVEELREVRDFLSETERFKKMGATIPRGVLLVGPPGTGKTLLAKAVAGEAGVPFFSISGSDFVEMFVGVGASRVRDLFKQAKEAAPCIIFIDEIDAVGRQRGAGVGGGHDEREQTLNQLLVEMPEVEEAMERCIAGPERKSRVITDDERKVIAYHEGGHALVGHVLENSDPVHKISIISRGQALGYTLQLPEEDHFLQTRNGMLDELAVLLGGRTAEELFCDDITTGASNDLERASKMAREMVTRYGMSDELGAQVFGEAQHQVFLGRDYADHQDYSAVTAKRIDDEVERIMREAHERARKVLEDRKDQMDTMAGVLLDHETVEGPAVEALLDGKWDEYVAIHDEWKPKDNDAAEPTAEPAEPVDEAADADAE